ncbi:MAG: hypothetical protein WCP57_09030 [Bacteroidota bacterium]
MKLFYSLYLCLLSAVSVFAADSISVSYDQLYIDNNANVYATTAQGIYKYNKNLVLQSSFEYNKYGAPSSIDLHIPMKVLLYFAAYNKFVVLDNRLAVVREIDINKINEDFNNVLCFSADNNFWMFDNSKQSLIKYNQNLSIIHQYENMNLRMNQFVQIQKMAETNNYLVLSDSATGFYIFDILGNYVTHFSLPGVTSYQLIDNLLFYVQDLKLHSIDILTQYNKEYEIVFDNTIRDFKISGSKIVLLTDKQIIMKDL